MKRFFSFFAALLLLLTMSACGEEKFEPNIITEKDVAIVDYDGNTVISYGMTKEEVEKVLGSRNSATSPHVPDYEGGVSVEYTEIDGKEVVYQIRLHEGSIYKTPRGINCYSSPIDISRQYGKYIVTETNDVGNDGTYIIRDNYYIYDTETKEFIGEIPMQGNATSAIYSLDNPEKVFYVDFQYVDKVENDYTKTTLEMITMTDGRLF